MRVIKKSDIIATVGFLGHIALVDKKLKRTLKNLTLDQLLEKGYYREAICWALFEKDRSQQEYVVDFLSNKQYAGSFDFLCREYGLEESVFDKIKKIKYI